MKQFADHNTFVTTSENSSVKLLPSDKVTELARLLGLEVVEFEGEGTINVLGGTNSSYVINKKSIRALKYDDDFLFYIQYNSSEYFGVNIIDSNFDHITRTALCKGSSFVMWYAKNDNAILFRSNSMTSLNCDYSVCITKARNADGGYIPVVVYSGVVNNSNNSRYIIGKGISDNVAYVTTISPTYYTLLSIAKLTFPNAQLVCDYVYYPTHMGYDFSPKTISFNGETWVYTGSKDSSYPGNGLFIKLDK